MKFIGVFVLYIYVRTAYSYYVGSTYNPIPQNTESALPGNVQNAYSNSQQTINYPPVPIQQEYNMGPGIPFPIQIAKTDPEIQNDVQKSRPYSGDPSYYSNINRLASLENMYKTAVPNKRYTIVHPNGTIEHTDEISTVKARYNNYVMVKAADILAHFKQLQTQNGISHNIAPNDFNKPITTTNQNAEWLLTNTYNNGVESVASNENPIDQPTIPYSTQNLQESKVVSSNPAGIQTSEITNEQNIQEVNQDSYSNFVAANPLPVHPTTPVFDTVEENEKLSEPQQANDYFTVTPSVGDAASMTEENSIDSTSTIPTTDDQLPVEISDSDALQVFIPKLLQESVTQETQTPTTIEGSEETQDIPEISTIEEPLREQIPNDTETSSDLESTESATVLAPNAILDVSQSNDSLDVPSGTVPSPITTISNVVEEPSNVSKESNSSSDSDQLQTSFGNNLPLTWFTLSENRLWDALRNNSSNVFFFFLPPSVKRVKEERKTIYPNGTIVEEIIERDEDKTKGKASFTA